MKPSTIVILALVGVFVIATGLYGYLSDQAAAEPFDAQAELQDAIVAALEQAPGQSLYRLQATKIDPQGRIHSEYHGSLIAEWRPEQAPCKGLEVVVGMTPGIKQRQFRRDVRVRSTGCSRPLGPPPRCTFQQLWKKAIEKGAPTPAVADIALAEDDPNAGAPARLWEFTVTDRKSGQFIVNLRLPDDC